MQVVRLQGNRHLHPIGKERNHAGEETMRHRGCSDPACLEAS